MSTQLYQVCNWNPVVFLINAWPTLLSERGRNHRGTTVTTRRVAWAFLALFAPPSVPRPHRPGDDAPRMSAGTAPIRVSPAYQF